MSKTKHTEILVIGAGPGGYAAAFRAADLGKKVTLIDRDKDMGGCLFESRVHTIKSIITYNQSNG